MSMKFYAFTEEPASSDNLDQHYNTKAGDRKDKDIDRLRGTYRVFSIHIGLNLILCVELNLGLHGLVRGTALFIRLLRQVRGAEDPDLNDKRTLFNF